MQQPDQTDRAISMTEEVEAHTPVEPKPSPPDIPGASNGQQATRAAGGFDWLSVSIVVIIAILFAAAAHLNSQPASSFVPAAVLSATGCGLLITGLRKLRAFKGVGLFEAAVSGLLLALFQFISAFSFPGVLQSLSTNPTAQPGFYSTWGLVAFFAMFFSMIGATLGHLAFAPLRPLPARRARTIRAQDSSTN